MGKIFSKILAVANTAALSMQSAVVDVIDDYTNPVKDYETTGKNYGNPNISSEQSKAMAVEAATRYDALLLNRGVRVWPEFGGVLARDKKNAIRKYKNLIK